jgi:hypothetical protein
MPADACAHPVSCPLNNFLKFVAWMERSGIQVIAETPDYVAARLHPATREGIFDS